MGSQSQIKFDDNHYQQIMKKFNYEPTKFSRINFGLKNVLEEDLQRRWLCHHGADKASKRLSEGKKTIISTGIGISGVPHIGTISQIMRLSYFQTAGIDVNFVLGDLDAYNGKNKDLHYVIELTKQYFEFMKRLGLENKHGTTVRDQYNSPIVLRTMYLIGKYANEDLFVNAEEELHEFYAKSGKVDDNMSYRRKLSLNLMTADFIHLLLSDSYDNVIVALGIDEHQYVLFARRILERLTGSEFQPVCEDKLIAGLYSPLIIGLYGYPKMSKSFPQSSITVLTPKDDVASAIRNGEGDYDFPENNVIFQMMSAVGECSAEELKVNYDACSKRNSIWNGIKEQFIDKLLNVIEKWPA